MNYLEQTFPTPAENLACDEALLLWREQAGGAEILRVWEGREHFVVLGRGNKAATEVKHEEKKEAVQEKRDDRKDAAQEHKAKLEAENEARRKAREDKTEDKREKKDK